MIDPALRLLLTRLHSVSSPIITHAELVKSGGDPRVLMSSGILRRTDDLQALTSAAGTRMAVCRHAEGLYGVAEEENEYFDPVLLAEKDVIAYGICVPALVKSLRKANDLHASGTASHEKRPIYLGTRAIPTWGMLDVYLAFPADSSLDMLALCKTLHPVDNSQAVGLTTPLSLRTDSELQAILSANRIVSIPLYAHLGTCFAIDWDVAVGRKAPPLDPGSAADPLDRMLTRKFITKYFNISEDTIRRYDREGQTPKGATWQFIQDSAHKQRKLYNLRMVYDALGREKMKAEYRDRGEAALAQLFDACKEGEKPPYQVRGKPNGKMHE